MTDARLIVVALLVLLISGVGTVVLKNRKNRWAGLCELLAVCSGVYVLYVTIASHL